MIISDLQRHTVLIRLRHSPELTGLQTTKAATELVLLALEADAHKANCPSYARRPRWIGLQIDDHFKSETMDPLNHVYQIHQTS